MSTPDAAAAAVAVPWNLVYAVIVVVLSSMIAALNKRVYTQDTHIKYSQSSENYASTFISEASKWHTTAQQDTNPALALMHATYADAYANAARKVMDDGQIMRSAGVHMPEMAMVISATQQKAFQSLTMMCPNVTPSDADGYSLYTGYIG